MSAKAKMSKLVKDSDCLINSALNYLSKAEIASLVKKSEVLHFEAGEVIIDQGGIDNYLFILLYGSGQVIKYSSTHTREVILADLSVGDPIGEIALLTGNNRTASVRLIEASYLLKISKQAFEKHCLKHFGLLQFLTSKLAERLQGSSNKVADLIFEDVTERLLKTLRSLARNGPEINGERLIREMPSHSDLAKLVGVTRETVSRTLTLLEECKLIERWDRSTCLVR